MNIVCDERWLIASFDKPQVCLSWAIQGGGKVQTDTVAWYQVESPDLKPPVDPRKFLEEKLRGRLISHAVGMLTSADLKTFADVEEKYERLFGRSVVTVGMKNALRVGDLPAHPVFSIGTINLLCAVSVPLSDQAHLEALSIAVEARTLAAIESGIRSVQTQLPATGTGTDCVVIAAPCAGPGEKMAFYAGKHTHLGSVVGKAVFEAVSLGLSRWKERHLLKEVGA